MLVELHIYIKDNSLLASVTSFRYDVEQALGVRQYMYWYWLSYDKFELLTDRKCIIKQIGEGDHFGI